MIRSMTGFGRYEAADGRRKIAVEVRAVNHRYLDVGIKMPKKLGMFEAAIRGLLKEYMERGKVDMYVTLEEESDAGYTLRYNRGLAEQYLGYIRGMAREFGLEDDVRAGSLARFPDVFVMEEEEADEDGLWSLLETAVRGACAGLVAAREQEGARLLADLREKLGRMEGYAAYIEERSPQILAEYRARIEAKVSELLADSQIDDGRIAAEVAIFADKICVDEETVRLRSHIKGMERVLDGGGAVGRKLDFIAQEMNREANTILSKSTDLSISDTGIELKTDIEKVREQIQNIE